MLRFPIKSEIGQNFRALSAGLEAVNLRKMVFFLLSFCGMTSDEEKKQKKKKKKEKKKKMS